MGKRIRYGIPYKGSKNFIAPWIVEVLPRGERLVDLFAGGCAVTHCALLSGKYREVLANDINDAPQLFVDAANGRYRNEARWISREDFSKLKDDDPYVRWCWSFGNNGEDYLYSREIEPYMRACHYAIALDEWNDFARLCPEVADGAMAACAPISDFLSRGRRLAFGQAVTARLKEMTDENIIKQNPLYWRVYKNSCLGSHGSNILANLMNHARLLQMENLLHRERLQLSQGRLPLWKLKTIQGDYRNVEITESDVVYCDIPYDTKDKRSYNGIEFDRQSFIAWALKRDYPVFISEYTMPEGFSCIAEHLHQCRFSASTNRKVTERIFVQDKFASKYRKYGLL